MSRVPLLLSLAIAALAAMPLSAQDLSDEELLQLFYAQRDAFRAAEESGLGATRGLTLVTVEDAAAPVRADATSTAGSATATAASGVAAADPSASAADTDADAGVTVAGTGQGTSAGGTGDGTAPIPVVFGKLAPEMQVNVRVTFDFDSAALRQDQKPKLAQLCTVMKASDIGLFRIVGHTDASGSDDYNERLSRLRAEEVQRYFVDDCGLDPSRLEAIGLGERFLYDEDDPRSGENRRVEFQALS